MQRKKILFLISSLGKGGAERVLINLLNKIDRNKYQVDLCVVMKGGIYFKDIPLDVKIIVLLKNVFLARVFTYLQIKLYIDFFYNRLIREKIKDKYDVAVSFADSSYTELLFMLPQKPNKLIAWIHASYASYTNYAKYYTPKYKQKIICSRYSKIDTIVFVSNDSMSEFKTVFGVFPDMRVIYNVLDIDNVLYNSTKFIPDISNKLNLIAVGSLMPVKGYDKLILACKMLKTDGLDFRLYILGEGPLKYTLKNQIDSLGLSENVVLKGFIKNPYPYIKSSDIFIMTSISEALPTALCEAMILGKPVVVTNSSGCREIIENGKYGILVERNVESIANGIKELARNNVSFEKYSKLSLMRAKEFSDEKVLEKVENLFNN